MLGVYFSGTGNTEYCVETFVKQYEEWAQVCSIEDKRALALIAAHDTIVLGYPVYFSNIPKIVRDFIDQNRYSFAGKKIFIVATMGLFSGDGAGCAARLLEKYHAVILGGLHLKMPDCIGDEKLLKRTVDVNRSLVEHAEKKIADTVHRLKEGRPTKEGLGVLYHLAGLFGQRLWFYGKTKTYKSKPDVDRSKCVGCGLCTALCPMKNIKMEEEKAVSSHRCTLCYRCVNHCPAKALTILGKEVHEQCLLERYISGR